MVSTLSVKSRPEQDVGCEHTDANSAGPQATPAPVTGAADRHLGDCLKETTIKIGVFSIPPLCRTSHQCRNRAAEEAGRALYRFPARHNTRLDNSISIHFQFHIFQDILLLNRGDYCVIEIMRDIRLRAGARAAGGRYYRRGVPTFTREELTRAIRQMFFRISVCITASG
ncbi:hypothetical protein EVAR_10030_1 [Eumeta japonica]|uniref:Uncharacterized protein n=1 Tax=Eumeta variegata TaxID=151549 RepID=A0A4C1TRA9_EUMVA|nr:hypothetical protein EVAR_10030_1 [Eumeta japonica]